MGYLDSYTKVSDSAGPYITLRDRSITFSKTAIDALHCTEYVCMYINEKDCRVAFQESDDDTDGIPFYREPKEGRPVFVRISDKKKAQLIMTVAGISECGKGVRFYGKVIPEEKLIDFDLACPVRNE